MRRDFEEQLGTIMERLRSLGTLGRDLEELYGRLISLRIANAHHASMELVVAHHFLTRGHRVWVEYERGSLVLDVYALRDGEVGVEVETAFIPQEVMERPEEYLSARITVKVARYGNSVQEFYLAVPSYVIPPIPRVLLLDPAERGDEELKALVRTVRKFYALPNVNLKTLREGRLAGVLWVNLSRLCVSVLHPHELLNSLKVHCPQEEHKREEGNG